MSKLRNMRVIEIPKFRAVSSGPKPLDAIFGADGFDQWVKAHADFIQKSLYEPNDFLWHENCDVDQSVWILPVKDGVTPADTAPYEIIEFQGGMYLVATADELDPDDLNETVCDMFNWIDASDVFERGDYPLSGMCNMPNPDGAADKALGIAQQQIFLPLRLKSK